MPAHDPRLHPAFVIFMVTLPQLVTAMANAVLPVISPRLAEVLGVDPVLVGYQVSLLFGAAMLGTLYGGSFVARYGPARTAQICACLCAAGLALFAVPHIAAIIAGSAVAGFGTGLINSSAAQILVKYTPPEWRNLSFSIKQTGTPLGGMIASLTAPVLAVSFGWQWALLPGILLAVVAVALCQYTRPLWDNERRAGAPMGREALDVVPLVWRLPAMRWLSVVALGFSATQRILLTFVVIYLVGERGFSLIEAGVMLSVMQAAGFVSRPLLGWVADRIGSSLAVLMIDMAITMVGTLLLIGIDSSWPRVVVYPIFALLGLSALGWNGVLHAEAARLSPPGMASVLAGGSTFFVFAGVFLGPSLFAAAYAVMGSFAATYPVVIVVGLVSMVLLAAARKAAARGG
jgi:MFS family permease